MNKYQEAYEIIFDDLMPMPKLNERNRDWLFRNMDILQEAIDKANKYDDKETPKKVFFLNYGGYKIGNWHCPVCDKIVHRGEDYCINCGQKLVWSDEDE